MQYVVLNSRNQAQEILLNEDPLFPNVPLEERYSTEFLNLCLKLPDSTEVTLGWVWDFENNVFVAPVEPEPVDPPDPEPGPEPTSSEVEKLNARMDELESVQEAMMEGLS